MDRDYAKKNYLRPRRKPIIRRWTILALIVLVLVVISVLFVKYKSNTFIDESSQMTTFLTKIKSIFVKHTTTAAITKKPEDNAEQEVEFSFYNELPNMHVEVPSEAEVNNYDTSHKVAKTPSQEVKSMQVTAKTPALPSFILQFGVFKQASAASQLRLSLLLAGIETEVDKIQTGNDYTYRVWQGPFATMSEAKAYQQKWQRKGIECSINKK
jgi:hypothetical protein